MTSIHSGSINRVRDIPLAQIRRPIPPVLNHEKIDAMVSTLKGTPMASNNCSLSEITSGELTPIDVMHVRDQGKDYYFAFGGCHRFQAYDKAGVKVVRCKVLPATKKSLKLYLGNSIDSFFEKNE
ncbi:hypothetical protein BABINDRAFT_162728 [Babjeviella inositovora NRRL Y-12698]|uniref:Sulfiredoxin n=1 Tax=Babjeviella inositovora NRRL Y-12698 TaxID=984486 RepID=A0A1E3QLF9_9ASCO|nr:uncharacterized protein BABINDRAFT_162728 [Babjeviella inositovora NRRL Y-12698]ODQ78523.1 hypothetical protein BABINDRAFT_162728 [Babjeviella inositovora NRRL Y-12698]